MPAHSRERERERERERDPVAIMNRNRKRKEGKNESKSKRKKRHECTTAIATFSAVGTFFSSPRAAGFGKKCEDDKDIVIINGKLFLCNTRACLSRSLARLKLSPGARPGHHTRPHHVLYMYYTYDMYCAPTVTVSAPALPRRRGRNSSKSAPAHGRRGAGTRRPWGARRMPAAARPMATRARTHGTLPPCARTSGCKSAPAAARQAICKAWFFFFFLPCPHNSTFFIFYF